MPYLHLVPILTKDLGISKPMDNFKINPDSIMVSGGKVHHQEPMLTQILGKIMVNTIGNIMVSIVTSIMIIGRQVHHQEPMLIQHLANISNNITVNLDLNKIRHLELMQIQRLDNLMGNQDNNKIQASTSMKIKQGVSLEFQLLHLHQ